MGILARDTTLISSLGGGRPQITNEMVEEWDSGFLEGCYLNII